MRFLPNLFSTLSLLLLLLVFFAMSLPSPMIVLCLNLCDYRPPMCYAFFSVPLSVVVAVVFGRRSIDAGGFPAGR